MDWVVPKKSGFFMFGKIPSLHLPLTYGPSVKCVIKKLFCFSFDFKKNWCT